ncbi:fimbria/pilus outer membrane usher protein [Chelatococcus sp. GCM10030263]|uniref:fimbria/pilus outer membrane usher protein n=1 Tax=Chelatococcus sp. GCM10030263 TaxID=3273387 RepID=UPI003622A1EC
MLLPTPTRGAGASATPHDAGDVQQSSEAPSSSLSSVQAARPVLDLQLEVFINGATTHLIGAFRHESDGGFSIEEQELQEVGLVPRDAARDTTGRIRLERLPGVTYQYDEAAQAMRFTAPNDARAPHVLNARPAQDDAPKGQSAYGAVLNYTLFANFQNESFFSIPSYQGVAGTFDGRLFSPFGTIIQSFTARTTHSDFMPNLVRLDTRWTYSDPRSLITYQAGDVISGGLSWTRPIRLGGLQVERNFGLRPDLVTAPLPELSGSAAVPSTVEIYANNARTLSEQVDAGPFQVTGLPLATGPGQARIIVRDALGREVVTEVPFYSSPRLLAEGLADFSLEAGYPRNFYGTFSDAYDRHVVGSATARHGLTNDLTVEGHTELGAGLGNGGLGAVFGLGSFGVGSAALAGSRYRDQWGGQLSAAIEFALFGLRVYANSQRTFGHYEDIASVTARIGRIGDFIFPLASSKPPQALDQLSISIPLGDNASYFNVNYGRIRYPGDQHYRIVGASYSRAVAWRGTLTINGYKDLDNKGSYGLFASLNLPLGPKISATAGVQSTPEGLSLTADAVRMQGPDVGDYGWRIRDAEGGIRQRAAAVSYRTPFAQVQAGVQQFNGVSQVTAQADGAIAVLGGGVFFANRIDDAFAVVDAGVPGVTVYSENRPVGTTDRSGRLLVPSLQSWQPNEITLDPTDLPVDVDLPETNRKIVPAERSGVVVDFGASGGTQAALVSFRGPSGDYVPAGSSGRLDGTSEPFVVGYDGEAYIRGLGAANTAMITTLDGKTCQAEFAYNPTPGTQVQLRDVVCREMEAVP